MRIFNKLLATLGASMIVVSVGGTAMAQTATDFVPEKGAIDEATKDELKEGWDPALSLGASIALSSNSNVIGQVDGASWTVGLNVLGRLDYREGVHEWRNTGKLNEVFTRTPTIDEWVKTIDILNIESVYYYKFADNFGLYGLFSLDTSIFKGTDVQPGAVAYVNKDTGANITTADRLKLTDAFQPLTLKESIGVFYRPISTKTIEVDIRAGVGALQVFADGALAGADDAATAGVIELVELKSFNQIGGVLGATAVGEIEGGRINYSAHAELFFPFVTSDPVLESDGVTEKGLGDLISYDLGAKVSFKLFEWASLDYEFKALLQPQLLDEWQIQNNLLLTFSFSLIE